MVSQDVICLGLGHDTKFTCKADFRCKFPAKNFSFALSLFFFAVGCSQLTALPTGGRLGAHNEMRLDTTPLRLHHRTSMSRADNHLFLTRAESSSCRRIRGVAP